MKPVKPMLLLWLLHKGFMEIKRAGKGDIIHQLTKDNAQGHFTDLIERKRAHVNSKLSLTFCFSVRNKGLHYVVTKKT